MERVNNPSRIRILEFAILMVLITLGAVVGFVLSGSMEYSTLFTAILISVSGIAFLGAYQAELRYKEGKLESFLPVYYYAFAGLMCAVLIALCGIFELQYIPYTPIIVILSIFIDREMVLVASLIVSLNIITLSEQSSVSVIIILLVLIAYLMLSSLKNSDMYLRLLIAIIYMVLSITGRILLAEISGSINLQHIMIMFVTSIVESIFYMLFGPIVIAKSKKATYQYGAFLSLEAPLARQIKEKSESSYLHALRVRRVCGKAASLIKADENLCKTAGFYYHLGHIFGEPEIDNGVKEANHYGMPSPAIDILSEYKGIIKKPSTKESAIVHMCDSVIALAEEQPSNDAANSGYMKLMIHSKLNELSQTGVYDNSGLSINEFLNIKDMLAGEELLK